VDDDHEQDTDDDDDCAHSGFLDSSRYQGPER
jgi:hypothetical protein